MYTYPIKKIRCYTSHIYNTIQIGCRNTQSRPKVFIRKTMFREIFWASLVKILVFRGPTNYMLWSSGFLSQYEVYYIGYFLEWSTIFMKSWTSTIYFSNSTGSYVTSSWFLCSSTTPPKSCSVVRDPQM